MTITDYFFWEKVSGFWLMLLGGSSIALLVLTMTALQSSQLLKGLSHVSIVWGLLVFIIGATIYFRTDQQLTSLLGLLDKDIEGFISQESSRVQTVLNGFSVYKLISLSSIIIGAIVSYKVAGNDYYLGLGLGLIVFPAIILSTDIILERNAQLYLNGLELLR